MASRLCLIGKKAITSVAIAAWHEEPVADDVRRLTVDKHSVNVYVQRITTIKLIRPDWWWQ